MAKTVQITIHVDFGDRTIDSLGQERWDSDTHKVARRTASVRFKELNEDVIQEAANQAKTQTLVAMRDIEDLNNRGR